MGNAREIRPHPGPQELFLASPADIAIYGGQAGGGKTFALLMEGARHVHNPKYRGVIFRRTLPRITMAGGMWDTSSNIYPGLSGKPFQSPRHEWRFPSGSTVSFEHLQHEKDKEAWQGAQIPFIGWDQLEEFAGSQFWYLWSRGRDPVSGIAPYMRGTCNPVPADDPEGGWLRELLDWWIGEDGYPIPERQGILRWFVRFHDELMWFGSKAEADGRAKELGLPEDASAKSLTFIAAALEDNPTLMREDPGYLATLEALPLVERMRLRGGNWNVRAEAGVLFNRAWFGSPVDMMPYNPPARVRYWDKAATQGGGAMTAGVKWAGPVDGLWYVEDVVYGHWGALERNRVIRQTAELDGYSVPIVVEQEPGSGGKESAEATIRELVGWDVRADPPSDGKIPRSANMRAQAEAGFIRLIRADWNEAFLRQAHNFQEKKRGLKDIIDAAVGGFNWLTRKEHAVTGIELGTAFLDLGAEGSNRFRID